MPATDKFLGLDSMGQDIYESDLNLEPENELVQALVGNHIEWFPKNNIPFWIYECDRCGKLAASHFCYGRESE